MEMKIFLWYLEVKINRHYATQIEKFYVYVSVGAQALVIVRIHGTLEILPKRGECENFLV